MDKKMNRVSNLCRKILDIYREKTFKPYIKKVNINGTAFDFLISDPTGKAWYDPGSKAGEWIEMRFIKNNIVRVGDIILECGGHHGCTTIALSKWAGKDGKVITFEPNPKNAATLRKNVNLNNLTNVIVEQKVAGSINGKIAISDAMGAMGPRRHFLKKEVDVITLDNYIDLNPTFLKIDVDGYEIEVLKGAKNILKKTPKLAIEIHPPELHKRGTSADKVLSLLDLSRYHCWAQWDDTEEPKVFYGKKQILGCIHLFAIPKEK